MFRVLIAAALLLLGACTHVPPPPSAAASTVILISIDGFRPDYLDRGITPVMSGLAAEGASGAMRPSFPSKTFPNHYTLVTGLRPDHHGIVDNNMRDPAIPDVAFSMSNKAAVRDRRWWDGGEPIWVTAEKAGIRTATMFWPGSEAKIHGVRPSLWRPFDQSMSANARVDQVLAWLDLPPAARPKLVTLYFDEVDTVGHHDGPVSPGVNAAIARTDAAIGRLVDGLKARGLVADLLIVADHGMAAVSPERVIYLEDIVPLDAFKTQALGAFMSGAAAPGREAEVERALLKPHPRMQCWRKGEIPARYHYGTNPRIPPIFCLPQTGWEITTRSRKPPTGGNHGFDPYAPEMQAVFIGEGPSFRPGTKLGVFDNVEVYPKLRKALGL